MKILLMFENLLQEDLKEINMCIDEVESYVKIKEEYAYDKIYNELFNFDKNSIWFEDRWIKNEEFLSKPLYYKNLRKKLHNQ